MFLKIKIMFKKKYNITIIGAGAGGQTMAGHFSLLGHNITLYNRNIKKFDNNIIKNKGIYIKGKIEAFAKIKLITNDIKKAVIGADIIILTTTANAHFSLARKMSKYLKDGQIVVLSPGRTLGALEFKNCLIKNNCFNKVYIGETQTLIYACRKIKNGTVEIYGIKNRVHFSALPGSDTNYILKILNNIYPCFYKAKNILETSLENIGAILHPAIMSLNSTSIKNGKFKYFYKDITKKEISLIKKLDKERLKIGKAFGCDIISVEDWISFAYKDIPKLSFIEKINKNPAYFKIRAPKSIYHRYLTEDIPMGIIPLIELGRIAGVDTKNLQYIVIECSKLLKINFYKNSRNLKKLGLEGLTLKELIDKF